MAFVCRDRAYVVPVTGKGTTTTLTKQARGPSFGGTAVPVSRPVKTPPSLSPSLPLSHWWSGSAGLAVALSNRCLVVKHEASLFLCLPNATKYVSQTPTHGLCCLLTVRGHVWAVASSLFRPVHEYRSDHSICAVRMVSDKLVRFICRCRCGDGGMGTDGNGAR